MICGLPQSAQDTPSIVSCFGTEFCASLLVELLVSIVEESLGLFDQQDLICEVSKEDGMMQFTHDQIQQSACGLMPEHQRGETHLSNGCRLLAFCLMTSSKLTDSFH